MYWKQIIGGYITAIGTGEGRTQITEAEYNEIINALRNCPAATDGFAYRFTVDLAWEQYELPKDEFEDDPELTEVESLDIILGGTV